MVILIPAHRGPPATIDETYSKMKSNENTEGKSRVSCFSSLLNIFKSTS